jgi:transcriptional regulator with XRE-family HTH domain
VDGGADAELSNWGGRNQPQREDRRRHGEPSSVDLEEDALYPTRAEAGAIINDAIALVDRRRGAEYTIEWTPHQNGLVRKDCVLYTTRTMKLAAATPFGDHVRQAREALLAGDRRFSLRQVATRIGVEPAYLSKVERGEVAPPGEETISRLADELGEDRDVLLALGGKVSTDLREIIRARPRLFAELLRELKKAPDGAVLRIVRQVRDGEW